MKKLLLLSVALFLTGCSMTNNLDTQKQINSPDTKPPIVEGTFPVSK